ncbi:MAG: hypothetical protein H8D45_03625 [Bacteroidetes bacterium]|nr:hypothetical protein [Bacteroidota bacterium]
MGEGKVKFYVGQLLKHNFDPGIFRVLTVLDQALEVERFEQYLDESYIPLTFWYSKAGWKNVQSSSVGGN